MVDQVRIRVKAGDGGKGHVSFRRLRGKPYGAPDGGDGGNGGIVIIKATTNLSTLLPYRYKKDFKAEAGYPGGKSRKKGAKGKDLVLEVPLGTLIKDEEGSTIADLTREDQVELVALGGKGGRGNAHIKRSELKIENSKFKNKREFLSWFEPGALGEEIILSLELKLLASVGLVGLPNAGKSTLLSKLTKARPKISAYPFTTLEPNLGVMYHRNKELVVADIPGLIEGASKGKGLGDQFLRHVERTRALVHLVSAESEGVASDLKNINNELSEYSKKLSDKPQIIILTKIDTQTKADLKNKIDQFKKQNIKVLPTSSVTGEGLEKLKDELVKMF